MLNVIVSIQPTLKIEMASGNPIGNGREGLIRLALFQRPFVRLE